MKQTIPELTNYEHNELYYNSAAPLIEGEYMMYICKILDKCGISVAYDNAYTAEIADAVSQFQRMVDKDPSGILNTVTWQAMLVYANQMSDIIVGEETAEDEDNAGGVSASPHYTSFFNKDNYKSHRRNNKNIKIVLGNKSIVKTIRDVYMRSVAVDVNTSGTPIYEVYEFIAKDVTETDEIADTLKYLQEDTIKYTPSSPEAVTATTPTTTGSGGGVLTGGALMGGGGSSFSQVNLVR